MAAWYGGSRWHVGSEYMAELPACLARDSVDQNIAGMKHMDRERVCL